MRAFPVWSDAEEQGSPASGQQRMLKGAHEGVQWPVANAVCLR